ncbi:hypothetical protein AMTR_s00202p00037600 [Amborella trichopoda]|uniref:WLM domain-containing protein n=1 Tax=Amborella trichopoda TaxID=13333 RepID=W1NN59_AMBTC|nr:hypothetical protein AMTR_s00202p00037600 [Amborella trichopoda]
MEEEDIKSVTVIWKGKQITVETNSGSTVEELGQKLQTVTNVKPETMWLLVPRSTNNSSKLLLPFSHEHSKLSLQETAVLKWKSIRMMGVFSDEIEEVSHDSSKPDLTIAGFDEEEKRLRQRTFGRPQSSLRLPQGPYIFCDFCTLSIPGIQLSPPPTEVLQRMHMLASDPGIVAIMNKHKWRVGIMTELAPVGYVGVSPECILGFNKNHGEEISLRLRTDDLKGFRKYESIKKTLLHELAHMVHSKHDTNFYALDKQLNQEAVTLDWTKSKRHTLSGTSSKDDYEWETQIERVHHAPKLGGRSLNPGIHNSSDNGSEEPKKQADAMEIDSSNMNSSGFVNMGEPDPDDGDSVKSKKLTLGHEEPDPDPDDCCLPNSSIMEYMNTSLPDPDGFCDHKISEEPDLDDLCDHRQREEPDPDDLIDHRRREEPDPDDLCDHRKREEPDPDDLCDHRKREEPGPDEFSTKKGILKHVSEPDPDDDEIHEEPDPDETNSKVLGNELKTSEPDPDDTGVSEAMAIEPDQDDTQDISEGFKPDPKEHLETQINEPEPDDFEKAVINEPDLDDSENARTSEPDPDDFDKAGTNEPDPDDTEKAGANEPDPDYSDKVGTNEPVRDDSENAETFQAEGMDLDELRRIQDSVTIVTTRLQSSIERLKAEASPFEAASVILTLFKILRCMACLFTNFNNSKRSQKSVTVKNNWSRGD